MSDGPDYQLPPECLNHVRFVMFVTSLVLSRAQALLVIVPFASRNARTLRVNVCTAVNSNSVSLHAQPSQIDVIQ